MSKTAVTLRYAKAMLDGLSPAHLQELQRDIRSFQAVIADSDLKKALSLPLISKEALKTVFDQLFAKSKPHLRLQGLVSALVANGRAAALPDVLKAADQMIANQGGGTEALVTTPKPLSDAERDAVAKSLSAKVGKPVTVQTAIDESLIGGMVVRMGSLQIDDSVKTKLDRLRRHLAGKAA